MMQITFSHGYVPEIQRLKINPDLKDQPIRKQDLKFGFFLYTDRVLGEPDSNFIYCCWYLFIISNLAEFVQTSMKFNNPPKCSILGSKICLVWTCSMSDNSYKPFSIKSYSSIFNFAIIFEQNWWRSIGRSKLAIKNQFSQTWAEQFSKENNTQKDELWEWPGGRKYNLAFVINIVRYQISINNRSSIWEAKNTYYKTYWMTY